MKERPILFSAPMVRAIRAGTKTQTRRVVKGDITTVGTMEYLNGQPLEGCSVTLHQCPYGVPGDILVTREPWRTLATLDALPPRDVMSGHPIWYEADGPAPKQFGRYRHARFMCRWMCRDRDEITSVRVERLQDISGNDCLAEGIKGLTKDGGRTVKYGISDRDGLPGNDDFGWHWKHWTVEPHLAYRRLWESINGPGSWDANPWVWVIGFRRIEA